MKKSWIGILLMMSAVSAFGQTGIRPGQTIRYDEMNYLTSERVGRQTQRGASGTSVTTGVAFTRLHVFSDEKPFDVDLVDQNYGPSRPQYSLLAGPLIEAIKYASKNTIWIVSYAHAISTALLYDLDKKKVIQTYKGGRFSISPDGTMIAYDYELVRLILGHKQEKLQFVFVNDALVYPVIEPGFVHDSAALTREEMIRKPDGRSFTSFVPYFTLPQSEIKSPIVWKAPGTIEFSIQEQETDKPAALVQYQVTGLTMKNNAMDAASIKVAKTPGVSIVK